MYSWKNWAVVLFNSVKYVSRVAAARAVSIP